MPSRWPRPVPGTPRWAVVAAYAAMASVVPAGIWRTLVGTGVDLGWTSEQLELQKIPGSGTLYVLTLTVLSIGCAALTLGLVYRWGEVFPSWVPALGGRRVPTPIALVAALLGVLATGTIVSLSILAWEQVSGFADRPDSGWARLMIGCYLPAVLWPPLLAAVAVAYWRRRTSSELPIARGGPAGLRSVPTQRATRTRRPVNPNNGMLRQPKDRSSEQSAP